MARFITPSITTSPDVLVETDRWLEQAEKIIVKVYWNHNKSFGCNDFKSYISEACVRALG